MDEKKLDYEKPCIGSFGTTLMGRGVCAVGSGDSADCGFGNNPGDDCVSGTSAVGGCCGGFAVP
ncbi:MAG TPA: hypothetical protein ENI07_01095 [Desulfobacterales bacterium]|nr:hypothetical protein [Desulfobacterales bacterium]